MMTDLLTTRQVADLLQVHPKHIYRLLRRGLPGRKVGGEWRFHRETVLAWAGSPRPSSQGSGGLPPLVATNGDLAVDAALYLTAQEEGHLLGTVRSDRTRGLDLLRNERVLGAGYHGPTGREEGSDSPISVIRIHVVRRQVGLAWRRGAAAPDLGSLRHRRFASRPPTAGVRHHLDRVMADRGVDSGEAHRHALIMGSHREVVRTVVAGQADVGVTTRAWASFCGLDFATLVEEDSDVVFPIAALADARVLAFARTLGSQRFREAVRDLPGYDTGRAGTLAEGDL